MFEVFTYSAPTVYVSPGVPMICAVVRVPEVFYGSMVQMEARTVKYYTDC